MFKLLLIALLAVSLAGCGKHSKKEGGIRTDAPGAENTGTPDERVTEHPEEGDDSDDTDSTDTGSTELPEDHTANTGDTSGSKQTLDLPDDSTGSGNQTNTTTQLDLPEEQKTNTGGVQNFTTPDADSNNVAVDEADETDEQQQQVAVTTGAGQQTAQQQVDNGVLASGDEGESLAVAQSENVGRKVVATPENTTPNVVIGTTSAQTNQTPAVNATFTTGGETCPVIKNATSTDWAPGMYAEPAAQPYKTLASQDADFSYTDSRADGVMKNMVDRVQAMGTDLKAASKTFAMSVTFAKFEVTGKTVKVEMDVLKNNKPETIYFWALFDDKVKTKAILGRVDKNVKALTLKDYSAELNCVDKGGTCKSIILTLNQLDAAGKVKATAFIAQRQSDVALNLDETVITKIDTLTNTAQKAFGTYLLGNAINSCVSSLFMHNKGTSVLDACTATRLKQQCDGLKEQTAAFKRVTMRTWAAAYGRASFKLEFVDIKNVNSLEIYGPLIYSATKRPMITSASGLGLDGKFKDQLNGVDIIANDGAGHLNLHLKFKGSPAADMRLNLSTLVPAVQL